jgi:hypothetical protein
MEYPRFESLRDEFFEVLDRFRAVVDDFGLGAVEGRQVEVTYVNWVPQEVLAEFLRPCGDATLATPGIEGLPIAQSWRARYAVQSGDRQVGVLHVEAKPGQRRAPTNVESGHTLTLTYLGPIKNAPDATIEAQVDRGRDAIVRSFAELTEEDMHTAETWGRTQ